MSDWYFDAVDRQKWATEQMNYWVDFYRRMDRDMIQAAERQREFGTPPPPAHSAPINDPIPHPARESDLMDSVSKQDFERQRRQQEQSQADKIRDNDYWWHPTQGFWAWMKRQDEEQQRARADAQRADESFHQKKQELSREAADRPPLNSETRRDEQFITEHTNAQRLDAARRHDDLVLMDQMKAYYGTFNENAALELLWRQAAEGKESNKRPFDDTRDAFWRLINEGESEEAKEVRCMLESAGFELRGGSRAPMLKIEGLDLERKEDSGHNKNALTLSIDHLTPQSLDKTLMLEPENLRFSLLDDNSTRGNKWTKDDEKRYPDPWDNYRYEPTESLRQKQEEFRGRVESMLREQELSKKEDMELERRQQEQSQADKIRDNDYWWHPTQGFWAWMKRQDEEHQRKTLESLANEFESWRRRQDLDRETGDLVWKNREAVMHEFESWRRQQDHATEAGNGPATEAATRHDYLLGLEDVH